MTAVAAAMATEVATMAAASPAMATAMVETRRWQEVAGVWIKQAMFSQGESSISSSSVLLQIISLVKALMEGPPTAAIMAVSSNFSRCIRPQRRK